MPEKAPDSIAGIILAGGLGRRMGGGDKPLVEVGGKPMLSRVIDRLAPQVGHVALNANGDPVRFAAWGLPVVADTIPGFAGPLAGVLAGMRWAAGNVPNAVHLVSVAGDTPFFPPDLASRLWDGAGGRRDAIALATSSDRTHPVFALWPIALADHLQAFLESGAGGKILAFVDRHKRVDVSFPDAVLPNGERLDPFFNVNTPEDAARAESIAAELCAGG